MRDYKPALLGVFAEFERGILSERVKAGLAIGSCACCYLLTAVIQCSGRDIVHNFILVI